jgi:two-component system response regulator DegU
MLVIGETADGQSACELAISLIPDVVVMDLSMPKLSGIEATERLKLKQPAIRVLALSFHEQSTYCEATARSWCVGLRAQASCR